MLEVPGTSGRDGAKTTVTYTYVLNHGPSGMRDLADRL